MNVAPQAPVDRSTVERIVREVVYSRVFPTGAGAPGPKLVVNISARHMHICREHMDILFGPEAKLTAMRMLYQEGQFAADQTVTIIGPRHRMINNLRILGPERKASQIELAFTDAIAIGIDAPVRASGKIDGTPGCIVMGPKGHVVLERGVIRAERHVHMHPDDAAYYGVQDKDRMSVRVISSCSATLHDLLVRVNPDFKLEVHLDTDEGNACDLPNARHVELIKE
jgi:putative phosphotransacetylase